MAEKKIEQRVYRVHYTCDDCGEGEMIAKQTRLGGYSRADALCVHTCDKCGAQRSFDVRYPLVRHEDVGPGNTVAFNGIELDEKAAQRLREIISEIFGPLEKAAVGT